MTLKIYEEVNKAGKLSESPLITLPEILNIPRKGEYISIDDKVYVVSNIMYCLRPTHPGICIVGVKLT